LTGDRATNHGAGSPTCKTLGMATVLEIGSGTADTSSKLMAKLRSRHWTPGRRP
jgi:hypothetical protein